MAWRTSKTVSPNAPVSRIVVIPIRSASRRLAPTRCPTTPGYKASSPSPCSGSVWMVRWVWQSMSPGMRKRPPRSMTLASSGLGGEPSVTEAMCPSVTVTETPSRTAEPVPSKSLAFVRTLVPGAGSGSANRQGRRKGTDIALTLRRFANRAGAVVSRPTCQISPNPPST